MVKSKSKKITKKQLAWAGQLENVFTLTFTLDVFWIYFGLVVFLIAMQSFGGDGPSILPFALVAIIVAYFLYYFRKMIVRALSGKQSFSKMISAVVITGCVHLLRMLFGVGLLILANTIWFKTVSYALLLVSCFLIISSCIGAVLTVANFYKIVRYD